MGLRARLLVFIASLLALWTLTGCSGGHSMRTIAMRSALDAGRLDEAVGALNKELGVKSGAELPKKIANDDALLVLDRATIHQALARHDRSKADYQAADKAIDVLDLSKSSADDIGKWVFSDSAGRYVAPPHEKLLVNVLNMLNYLETRDLSGARVEARRMVVTSRYLRDRDRAEDRSLAFGSLVAGFTYEKSGEPDEARRFYADSARIDPSLVGVAPADVRLASLQRSPPDEIAGTDDGRAAPDPSRDGANGEIFLVVGDGRVPHRIANHVPIGLALTRAAPYLSGGDHERASKLAAQGLVTWVSYPTLAKERPLGPMPVAAIDGRAVSLEPGLDVTGIVRGEWRKIEGDVMAAAVMRAVVRVAAGKAIEGATGTSDKKEVRAIGFLASIVLQAAMSAADVPDTRSWETLPARLSFARIQVPPGVHTIVLEAGGMRREGRVRVAPGGWTVATLMSLR